MGQARNKEKNARVYIHERFYVYTYMYVCLITYVYTVADGTWLRAVMMWGLHGGCTGDTLGFGKSCSSDC